MRILCLIIDATPHPCWQPTYAVHRQAWHKCLDRCPAVDGYFIHSDPSATACSVDGRRFVAPGQECHGTILHKTLRAIDALLAEHDYVVRTNISSLYDFPLLSSQALPAENLYMGHSFDGYVTGSGMVLSRDVARKLLAPTELPSSGWDDVDIGGILRSRGVQAQHREAFIYDYSKGFEQVSVGQHVHYRLRDNGDPQRVAEREVTERVFSRIYQNQ